MRRSLGKVASVVAGAVVTTALLVLAGPGGAEAMPAACGASATDPDVYTWVHDAGTDEAWESPALWQHTVGGVPTPGVPPSDGSAIACLDTHDSVHIGAGGPGTYRLNQLQLGTAATVEVAAGSALITAGSADSVLLPGSTMVVAGGTLGGAGNLRVQGTLVLRSDVGTATLSSVAGGTGLPPPSNTGHVVVEGQLILQSGGADLVSGYHVLVAAGGRVTIGAGAWLAADSGTFVNVQAGGAFEFAGDGGYLLRAPIPGYPASVLHNDGVLRKMAGTGTSVVDATYEKATGQVVVQTGTLGLPDSGQIVASVSPGAGLTTGVCGVPGGAAVCPPTTDPVQDVMNVGLLLPADNGSPGVVRLEERGPVSESVDPLAIGNEVMAHIDGLVADLAHPATLMLRYSQDDVMATPIDQVQVVHSPDSGPPVPLPNCVGGALVAGQVACVLRPVVRTAQNTFVTVLTTETSRWRVRRSAPITLTTPPVAPAGLKVAEAKPYDGSVLRVKWSKVTGSSAASSYRVILDGKVRVKAPRDKAAVTIKNPGPGKHRIQVVGVNLLGVGVPARAKVTIKALARPRRVTAVPGAAGGRRTLLLSWRRPAESGGLAVTRYQVIVRNTAGQRVRAVKVASGRQVAIALPQGRYRCAVRARNAGGAGPWSPATPAVRPR